MTDLANSTASETIEPKTHLPVVDANSPQDDSDSAKRPRKGAAGKALLVYLGTGSIGAALIAYLLFHSMGC